MNLVETLRQVRRRWASGLRGLLMLLLAAGAVPLLVGPARGPVDVAQASPAAAPPPPQTLGSVISIPPTRVLDTRPNNGPVVTVGFDGTTGNPITAAPLPANTTRRFLINGRTFPQGTGTFTFPSTFGVLANVTIVSANGVGGGFVTVFPGNVADTDRPNASTVNPSTPIAFDFTSVGISPTGAAPSVGTIAIFTTNTLDVVIDVVGYFTSPDAIHWSRTGNALTSPTTNFLGTTDAQPLVVRTNNVEALRVLTGGSVAIGGTSAAARLDVTSATGGIGVLATSDARGVIGRLGEIACPGTYGVGGCADGGDGVVGLSNTGRGVQGFSTTGIGVIGNSNTRGLIGTLGATSCAAPQDGTGAYAVGGCAATGGDGVYGQSAVPANSITGAAIRGNNEAGGDIFLGTVGGNRKARIDGTGRGFFNGGTANAGADYADVMPSSDESTLEPGDVLAIDPDRGLAVRRSTAANSRLVAGVYSTKPSVLGVGDHRVDDRLIGEVPVALVGIVPTKVSTENGPIRPGDLLTSAGLPGHAMKAPEPLALGTIIGKALEPLDEGTGVIRVLVTLR